MGAVWENPAAAAVPGKYRWCLNMAVQYKRILLKVSGEALSGEKGTGFDEATIASICAGIKAAYDLGAQIGIVVGGGNFWRGRSSENIDRTKADQIGMLATVMNALALQDAFEHNDVPCRVMSAIQMNEICEPYIRRRAINHLSKGNVVIFAAGSGNPYFTTDTAAALRACEIGAEILIKATKVDGIYDKDPVKCSDAVRFDKITYHEVLVRGLQVMDSTATALCQDNRMPILVLNIDGEDTVKRALSGEPVGTLVYQED